MAKNHSSLPPARSFPERFPRLSRALEPTTVLILGVSLLLSVTLLYRNRLFFHDDSFITLRYAANWLAGHGPVWNPGERVEGFTHPLWLLQVTGLGALGLDLPLAARLLGYFYLGALVVIWIPAGAHPLFLLALVTLPGLTLWSGGGLELSGFSLFLVQGAWQTLDTRKAAQQDLESTRAAILAGLAFAAAALMRPEGTGVGVLALVWVALARRWRPLGLMAAAFLGPLVSYLSFRLLYYGDYLPTSARAKIDGLPVVEQIARALEYLLRVRGEWVPTMALALICLFLARRSSAWAVAALSTPIWGGLLLGGGDHMPGARLATPAVILILYGAALAARDRFPSRPTPSWLIYLVLVVSLWQAIPTLCEEHDRDPAAASGRTTGRALAKALPAGSLVAVATAGSTPYHALSLRFIDTLGINDPVIAQRSVPVNLTRWQQVPGHKKGHGRYVLEREPDVIVLGHSRGWLGDGLRTWFLGDFELLLDPDFYRHYTPYEIQILLYSPREDREAFTEIVLYLRNGSPRVASLRRIGRRLHHPYPGPPDPSSLSVDLQPPLDHPESVPILSPLYSLVEAMRGRAETTSQGFSD